jgi:copper-(or silver)-translocating P-type ATPase/heavy metal-(Cd/Co/Hg/Pb/Zn)-translocating P-type ATPase
MTGNCFHCGEPVPSGIDYSVVIQGEKRDMCCLGCEAVAQAIVDNGLEAYYQHRTALPQSARDLIPEELRKLDLYNHPEIQKSFVITPAEHLKQASLILEGITCAACVWLNERHLQQLPGVTDVMVNYSTHRARVTWDEREIDLARILREVQLLGYNAYPFNAKQQEDVRKKERQRDLRRIAVAGISMMQVMMLAVALYAGDYSGIEASTKDLLRYASLVLTLPVMLYAAIPFYKSAWRALQSGRMNMDVPVTLAIFVAFGGSLWMTAKGAGVVYYDAVCMFSLFLLTTRFLERNAREKSTEAAENLLRMVPAMATRLQDGGQQVVPVMELEAGDLILVKPGESIAADGSVTEGASSVDESLLTGESRPVPKEAGVAVIAGSLNLEGPLQVQVTGVGENTVIAGIIRMLDRAQAEKPRLAQLADRVAGHFTYGLLALAAVTALGWWLVDPAKVFAVTLSVLVVTCPCALSLAAPAAFAAAGSRLLKQGILLTRGHALETLSHVNHVVFDKTGTLTFGKPFLHQTVVLADLPASRCLAIAASLEQASEHPLAASFLCAVEPGALLPVEQAQNTPGKGVAGIIGGVRYTLGNRQLSPHTPEGDVAGVPEGATVVWLCDETRPLAAFALADELRPRAREAVEQLKAAGMRVTILSGDSRPAVNYIAAQLGVESLYWEQRPEDKLAVLKRFQQEGEVVAMVGDGVNDAPVLAGAQVSMAMGSGTDVARATSDIVLLTQNLVDVSRALETGRESIKIMGQNFVWAIGYNALAVPIAVFGYIPPWLAAIGMSVSSLVVVVNALRLR